MGRARWPLSHYFHQRLLGWLDNRVPAANEHHLNLNSIFILPSGFGWSFIILSLCLFLLGTNYQNNLMLLLSYLCLSIMLLTLFYTHQNFARLALKSLPPRPFHCNQNGELLVQVVPHTKAPTKNCYGVLSFKWLSTTRLSKRDATPLAVEATTHNHHTSFSAQLSASINSQQKQTLRIPFQIKRRGHYELGRLTIACDFPLGLYKCWTHLDFDQAVTVYPKSQEGPVVVNNIATDEVSTASKDNHDGNEDFYALNDYEVGQPLNRVSWKHVAKNGNWVTKSFTALQSHSYVISLSSATDTEAALAALTHATITFSEANRVFGLSYKGIHIPPNHGVKHRHECLAALACFENSTPFNNAGSSSLQQDSNRIRAVK